MLFRTGLAVLGLFSICVATLSARPESKAPTSETPIWANDFVDTIGENTHCTFANIGWVDCRNPKAAGAAIRTLGIRHIRDGVSDYWVGYNNAGSPHIPMIKVNGVATPVTTLYNQLASASRVKFDFVIGLKYGNHAPYVNDIVTAVPATEAFELGGNEPDSPYTLDPCPSPNPNGLSCWSKDSISQIQFYSSYVAAAGRQRIGPSIEFGSQYTCSSIPGSQKVVLTPTQCPENGAPNVSVADDDNDGQFLDAANLHHYAGTLHPGNAELSKYRSNAKTFAAAPSTWVTEAGYGTEKNGNSDLRIAKYEPRIFAEDYVNGDKRTYQFEMFDQTKAAAGPYFDTFGLLSVNWADLTFTPKIQYEALRSLIQIMSDTGSRPTLVPLSYSITGGDSKVHHILTQRNDGSYQLLLWVEGPDPTPSQTISLSFCAPQLTVGTVSQFVPRTGQYTNSRLVAHSSGACQRFGPLNVTDAMQIYRFGTTAFVPATPMPIATPFRSSQ